MTYGTELHVDMEEVDGNMVVVSARAKHRGLLFWHDITIKELRNLVCRKEEEE